MHTLHTAYAPVKFTLHTGTGTCDGHGEVSIDLIVLRPSGTGDHDYDFHG